MSESEFVGTYTALVTPFAEDGAIDEATFRRLVERQIEGGVEGVVPCGTTGETPTLTEAEHLDVVRWTVETVGGRVKVVAGAGSNGTAKTVALARKVAGLGVDGLLVVTPYYNKPTQPGLIEHYRRVAEATDRPVLLYNVPGRTGVNLQAETSLALAEHPNIVAVKEASADLEQITQILRGRPEGFSVLSGEDSWTFPLVALGGEGVIGVTPNQAPDGFSSMVRAARQGDLERARTLHLRLFPLMKANFVESNPGPVKWGLSRMGLASALVRPPLVPLSEANQPRVEAALREAGLLEGDA